MPVRKAHNENKEPFLESVLSTLRFQKISDLINENSKILDLGCGYDAKFIKSIEYKKGCFFYGLDLSVDNSINSDRIKLISHDLNTKLPFENDSFDIVVSLASIEHLNNPNYTIREINRILKPGGKLLLTAPSVYSKPILEFLSYKLHIISENEIRDHKNYFNKQLLSDMCQQAGFSHIKHKYFQFFMNNFLYSRK
jgi:SAM-dependent methyltransferase